MKKLCVVFALVFMLTSCTMPEGSSSGPGLGSSITIWHDDDRNVTCWIYDAIHRGGISCLPDSQLENPNGQ